MAVIFFVSVLLVVLLVNGWFVVMEGTSNQPYTEALTNGRPGVAPGSPFDCLLLQRINREAT
jgi:hypothetical protein